MRRRSFLKADLAGIDTGRASRIAAALWHVTAERYEGTDERVRVEEGVIVKDGGRDEVRRRFDRLSSIRRTELGVVAEPLVDAAIRRALAARLIDASTPVRAVWTSFVTRLSYGLDHRLQQIAFDRRRDTQALDSRDVDGLLQLMGVLGTRSSPTFIDQVTDSCSMPNRVGGVVRRASEVSAPWLFILGGATGGSSSRAMTTIRQLQRTCVQRGLPVLFVVGTEHRTSRACPRADACPSRIDASQRGNTVGNPRRASDGSPIYRLSQCSTCGAAGDRDVFAGSNIAYGKLSELLYGTSEFSRPTSATASSA